jgi:hypothetical protein
MGGAVPQLLERWAFRVGANAAKASGIRRLVVHVEPQDPDLDLPVILEDGDEIPSADLRVARRLLRAQLERQKKNLVGRQFEVASKMCEDGMTLHRAAKELGMDRKSLRRSFRSALVRLKRR